MDKPRDTEKIDLSIWNDIDEADRRFVIRLLVDSRKISLHMALERRFGDDLQAKIDCLKKQIKVGSLTAIEALAFKEVLADLSAETERGRTR